MQWLIGDSSFTDNGLKYYSEIKKGRELTEWENFYDENILGLQEFIESESKRYISDCNAVINSDNLNNQPSNSIISSNSMDLNPITIDHGEYIERTIDSDYQITNLIVPRNLQFLSVFISSTDITHIPHILI